MQEEEGGCTLEEAVGVGRQWERTETLGLRKGEGTGEEESREGRPGGSGQSQRWQKWESRTLQGIKSLFVTGTVMKILCFWGGERRGRERERVEEKGGEGRTKLPRLSHTEDLWNTNQAANAFGHAGVQLLSTSRLASNFRSYGYTEDFLRVHRGRRYSLDTGYQGF